VGRRRDEGVPPPSLRQRPFIDDEVNHLSREWFALVVHHHGDLAIHAMPAGNALPLEDAKVNQLAVAEAEAEAERAVHLVKRGDDGARCLFFEESVHEPTVACVDPNPSITLWRGVSFYFEPSSTVRLP
jgi:hypothetical protein